MDYRYNLKPVRAIKTELAPGGIVPGLDGRNQGFWKAVYQSSSRIKFLLTQIVTLWHLS